MGAYPIGIVGESFDNEDGGSRQSEIARCEIGEQVQLERDPANKYDKNCVRVLSARGVQIGNISRDDGWICERMDKGGFVDARVLSIGKGKRGMGVVLCLRTDANDDWLDDQGPVRRTERQPQGLAIGEVIKGCSSLIFVGLIVWLLVLLISA